MQSGKADQNDDAQFFSRYLLKVAAVTLHAHSGALTSFSSKAYLKAALTSLAGCFPEICTRQSPSVSSLPLSTISFPLT